MGEEVGVCWLGGTEWRREKVSQDREGERESEGEGKEEGIYEVTGSSFGRILPLFETRGIGMVGRSIRDCGRRNRESMFRSQLFERELSCYESCRSDRDLSLSSRFWIELISNSTQTNQDSETDFKGSGESIRMINFVSIDKVHLLSRRTARPRGIHDLLLVRQHYYMAFHTDACSRWKRESYRDLSSGAEWERRISGQIGSNNHRSRRCTSLFPAH